MESRVDKLIKKADDVKEVSQEERDKIVKINKWVNETFNCELGIAFLKEIYALSGYDSVPKNAQGAVDINPNILVWANALRYFWINGFRNNLNKTLLNKIENGENK